MVCECCGEAPTTRDLRIEIKDTPSPTVGEALAKVAKVA
jgi:hypothetical protein